MTYKERTAEFNSRIDAGEKVEATHSMPDSYRSAALKFIEMHANSEIMGAIPIASGSLARRWCRDSSTHFGMPLPLR